MFIRVTKSPTSKMSKVYLVEGYRDENGKVKQRVIHCYGNLEELELEDPDILVKLKAQAKQIPKNTIKIDVNLNLPNSKSSLPLNYGYFFLDALFEELNFQKVLKELSGNYKFSYDLLEIVRLLTFSRFLNPASKLETLNQQKNFFEPFEVLFDNAYRALDVLCDLKEEIQSHLHSKISELYPRDCSLVFYDVTNYYFETEVESDLKKPGMSKENKRSPIVQMGLLIDTNGIPIAYKLFSGNTHDTKTLIPIINQMKDKYGFDRIVISADKGLNSLTNIKKISSQNDGYVFSQKIRGASKAFIKEVLSEENYAYNEKKTFKVKSFIRERVVKNDELNDGSKMVLKEQVVCFWSKNYEDREKYKREKISERIDELLNNPSKLKSSNSYGIKKYIIVEQLDEETGEIVEDNPVVKFDKEKYDNDVATDGYYAIITSEVDLLPEEVIAKYRGLWKIEESFRVMKSDLEGRPVYVRNDSRIEGHFLICFIALTLMRILEHKLQHKFPAHQIQKALKDATCEPLEKGIYLLNKQDNVFTEISRLYDTNFDFKYMEIEKIRQLKKDIVHNKFK